MANTTWLDADMCAALGAVLYRIGSKVNTIKLAGIVPAVEVILAKNEFLSHYGRKPVPDTWGTTIPYQRFETKDDRYFGKYIEDKFVQRLEMPTMSAGLLKKFRESIFEIFSNAAIHSHTKFGIYSCGQYYPKRNRLNFSVADLGIGIWRNVRDNTGMDISPEDAIEWATQGTNTTKRGPIPGGLGLKLLTEFVGLNNGSIQIVSDAGYWRQDGRQRSTRHLPWSFPGTVVTIEIDCADPKSYMLISEKQASSIF